MALICVEPLEASAMDRANELADLWKVPVDTSPAGTHGVKVVVRGNAIGLGFIDKKRGKPYYVDFLTAAWKTKFAQGLPRNHIFRRALGVRDEPLRVVDATAGFGQDSMLAICMGCEVVAIEKSNIILTALRNGVMRAMREEESLRPKLENLSMVEADAGIFLGQVDHADVVYLDPMFDKPKKSAKSPKEMQLLQELFGESPNLEAEERLFHKAFENAKSRVVVKRPLKARALVKAPTHSFKGQSIRYDVYVK